MSVRQVTALVAVALCAKAYSLSCWLDGFQGRYFTDLNYMIDESVTNASTWYVVAFEQPNLPYRTPYHLPRDIVTHRNCYSYALSTRLGVILMEFVCLEANATYNSFHIFTHPNGMYVTGSKGQQEVKDFRVVHVLQLTQTMVLLYSCSITMDTYGVLVLNRGLWDAQDAAQMHRIVQAKLRGLINYTLTTGSSGEGKCSCMPQFVKTLEGGHDKRKGFVLITFFAATGLVVIVKMLKRLF